MPGGGVVEDGGEGIILSRGTMSSFVGGFEVDEAKELVGRDVDDVAKEEVARGGTEEGEGEAEEHEDDGGGLAAMRFFKVQRRPSEATDEAAARVAEALGEGEGIEDLLRMAIPFHDPHARAMGDAHTEGIRNEDEMGQPRIGIHGGDGSKKGGGD